MAKYFNSKGLPSAAVDGTTGDAERHGALQRLRTGELNVVFAVNLFNEGVDVPAVDTVLFLRPTESATLFIQQLGRGLRIEEGKSCLTVLDFIGKAHRKFRFVDRFRAMAGGTRAGLRRALEEGFPHLPAGCDIRLDRESQEIVLANIRTSVSSAWRDLAADLRQVGDKRLPEFLRAAELEVDQLYFGSGRSYTALRHEAGFLKGELKETEVTRAIPRLTYVNDESRLARWSDWLKQDRPPKADPKDPYQLMFFAALGYVRRPVGEIAAALRELWAAGDIREELIDLFGILSDRLRRPTTAIPALPFRVHASYSRDEISGGLLQVREGKLMRSQGGVFNCTDVDADILYVEIDKDPKHYTPTTLYDDRPISPTRFQWESQSATRADSDTGRRYQNHEAMKRRVLLFVRHRADDERGFTSPYLFIGPVRYHSHESEKPMRIIWDLDFAMPPEFFSQIKLAAG